MLCSQDTTVHGQLAAYCVLYFTVFVFIKLWTLNTGSSAPTESLHLEPQVKTTPGLVKAVCWLMVNVLAVNPDDTLHHINKFGFVRLLFR
jgi:hypothetical protein